MRTTETLTRRDFLIACPGHLQEELIEQLNAWEGGDSCESVELTVDSLGNIDSESSPRPATA